MIHTIKGFSVVNQTDFFSPLEFSCFLYDPVDVENLKGRNGSLGLAG